MYQTTSGFTRIVITIADCVAIVTSLIIANLIRYGNAIYGNGSRDDFWLLVGVLFFVLLIKGVFRNNLNNFFTRGYLMELWYVAKENVILAAGSIIILFCVHVGENYSRLVIGYFAIFDAIIMWLFHLAIKKTAPYMSNRIAHMSRIALIGNADFINKILSDMTQDKDNHAEIARVFVTGNDRPNIEAFEGITEISDISELTEYCRQAVVDEVITGGDISDDEELQRALNEVSEAGIVIQYQLSIPEFSGEPYQTMTKVGDAWMAIYANRSVPTWKLFVKRAFDIVTGLIGSIVTLVITIIVGPLIKLESRGPIFFTQKRVGRNGRIFKIYKFRSMYADAEDRKKELAEHNEMGDSHMFKMENDPRITKIGRFIRKTSIDEFPQFFNILKGDMSLVGTRPPTLDEYTKYDLRSKSRLSFRPGLTGLWQVSGRNDIKAFEDIVKLDVEYIRTWSVYRDVKILIMTIPAMIKGR